MADAPTLSQALEQLQGVDFSPYPGLFDRIPWQEIEDAVTAAPNPIHVVCPQCTSPDVTCDAAARWSFEKQDWELSTTYDDRTCNTCGYEGSSFDEATEDMLTDEQRAYIEEGVDFPNPPTIKVCG